MTASEPKPATPITAERNRAGAVELDPADFERAARGLIATQPGGRIDGAFGTVWDVARHAFVEPGSPAPDTVHPSLWRQAHLNAIHGLFEVAPGLWQARGYDISNVSFIAGARGWIVIDPLTSEATAAACLALANSHLGERPVTAVIYTHSHADHYGGVRGVVSQAEVDAGNCRVIAPDGFMREVVAENVIAGPAMLRRSLYQFGPLLPPGPRGQVDCGLGKAIPVFGGSGLIAPTETITRTGEELVVDGVRIVFQNTPGTEAPAEMNFWFPDHGWLCLAENCTHNMHNLVPIRGAQVRDSLSWSKYTSEVLELFGREAELCFASHHWPRWGTDDVVGYLARQRDLYRWMHDQTMRLANHGLTPHEIAATLELAPEFADHGDTRGYYGHLAHNVRAVYQRYLSWYDANPAHLDPLPPVETGRRYVEAIGGADAVLAIARSAYDAGDYRWVAELVNHVVFADPANSDARSLQADTLEQLGYQSESATFRNAYLFGAHELRHGHLKSFGAGRNRAVFEALPIELLVDALAIRLRAEEVGGLTVTVNWRFPELGEDWVIGLAHRALHASAGIVDPAADVAIVATKALLLDVLTGVTTFADATEAGTATITGDPAALAAIFDHLDEFTGGWAIVEP